MRPREARKGTPGLPHPSPAPRQAPPIQAEGPVSQSIWTGSVPLPGGLREGNGALCSHRVRPRWNQVVSPGTAADPGVREPLGTLS